MTSIGVGRGRAVDEDLLIVRDRSAPRPGGGSLAGDGGHRLDDVGGKLTEDALAQREHGLLATLAYLGEDLVRRDATRGQVDVRDVWDLWDVRHAGELVEQPRHLVHTVAEVVDDVDDPVQDSLYGGADTAESRWQEIHERREDADDPVDNVGGLLPNPCPDGPPCCLHGFPCRDEGRLDGVDDVVAPADDRQLEV